jgi:uncharacterized membrane protein YGL010W
MFAGKTSEEWIAEYARGHQNPTNQLCHTIGIPMIVLSLLLLPLSLLLPGLRLMGVALFIVGWGFQFAGHWFEGTKPEFFKDWRFLFVGLRWWMAKMNGRV